MNPILEVEHFNLSFTQYDRGSRRRQFTAIRDLNLTVRAGEVAAVVGSSGSGKSLLAHALLDILPANSAREGVIRYRGEPLTPARTAALRGAVDGLSRESPRLAALRDRLIDGLTGLPYTRLTGDPVNRLPGTASFVFEGVEGEALLLHLDARGICASSGSACSSASLDPSHVLLAIGLPHAIAHGSLRLSLGAENTEADVDYILKEVPQVVAYLRELSPVWDRDAQKPTWEL